MDVFYFLYKSVVGSIIFSTYPYFLESILELNIDPTLIFQLNYSLLSIYFISNFYFLLAITVIVILTFAFSKSKHNQNLNAESTDFLKIKINLE